MESQQVYRLPTTVVPIHYDLTLFPKFTDPTYELDGYSHVLINISRQHIENEDTNLQSPLSIQMNMGPDMLLVETHMNFTQLNDTNIEEIITLREYNPTTEIVTFYYNVTNEKILNYLTNEDSSHPSTYILSDVYFQFQYEMKLNGTRGMYISSYLHEPTNVTVRNAVSSFGLQYARYGFPCFDEPQYKAEFDISIYTPVNTTVLSNAAIESERIESPLVTACSYEYIYGEASQCKDVTFETTPIMSAYIVSLIIGSYDNISAIDSNGVLESVYVPIGEGEYAQFALGAAVQILPYFGEIFDFEYPLVKMDNIALTQFAWGALENFGAIVYRKASLLSEIESSDRRLAGIATLVSHEFAHQWYGNIVTCAWWDDTWLNEGFATFFGVDAANIFYPDLLVYSNFLLSTNGVMMNDASIYAGTVIGVDIQSQSEVSSMFGGLQYTKGGAILRMLQGFVGNDSFYGALQQYVETYQYDIATSDDLFNILNIFRENSGLMVESYTRQSGMPVVYADVDRITDDEIIINLRQQRMVMEGPGFYDTESDDYGYSDFSRYFDDDELIEQFAEQKWWIPLKVETVSDDETQINRLMNEMEDIITVNRVKDDDENEYYLLNTELKNYVRVIYDDQLLDMIKESWESLSFWNQFNIIADRYELMTYNYASSASYLKLLEDIIDGENENDVDYLSYTVWSIIIDSLYTIDDRFCVTYLNDETLAEFRNFSQKLLKPVYNDLNGYNVDGAYDVNNADVTNLRNAVIMALIRFQDEDVIEDGVDIINNLNDTGNDEFGQLKGINDDILQVVITAGMASMDSDLYDLFFQIYRESNGVQRSYIRFAWSTLYFDMNIVMDTYEYILRGFNDSDGLFQLSSSDKVNGLNNLATCVGTGYVWDALVAENDNNNFNGTDFDMLFEQGSSINTLIRSVNTFATRDRYDMIYKFYYGDDGDLRRNENNERTINQTLENIAMNTIWIMNNSDDEIDEDESDGLEPWEITLIVIGSILFCVILIGLFYFFRRRKVIGSPSKYTQMASDVGVGYGATDATAT